jgi:uridine kinase
MIQIDSAPQGIYTILRDRTTSRQDFVFFTDRLAALLMEHALQHLPFIPKTVTTPVGAEAHGKKLDTQVCLCLSYLIIAHMRAS